MKITAPGIERLLGALSLTLMALPATAEQVVLNVRGYAQQSDQWCWAATTQTVIGFLEPAQKAAACQCRQAEARAPGSQCCAAADSCRPAESLSPQCRETGWPEFERFGFKFDRTCDPERDPCANPGLAWDAIVRELTEGRPIVRAYRPEGHVESALGHTVVVLGYRTTGRDGDQQWLLVFDPKRVCRATCDPAGPPCCHGDSWWIRYGSSGPPAGYVAWVDFFGIRKDRKTTRAGSGR